MLVSGDIFVDIYLSAGPRDFDTVDLHLRPQAKFQLQARTVTKTITGRHFPRLHQVACLHPHLRADPVAIALHALQRQYQIVIAETLVAIQRVGPLVAGLGAAQVYVEKIKLATTPALDAATRRERQDALGEMLRLLDEAVDDPDIRAMIEKDIRRLAERLPYEIRENADDALLRAAIDGDTATLIDGAGDYLLSRLAADESAP